MITPQAIVERLTGGRATPITAAATAFAPANIALVKYWGKRDEKLNLPLTDSLSISLGELGTETELAPAAADRFRLNGEPLAPDSSFASRLRRYLDLFRSPAVPGFAVTTYNRVPTAAGLASSASGYAALALALDRLFGWRLDRRALSILARLGSGSACRSIDHGFMHWHAGIDPDGNDSFAEPLDVRWPAIRVGVLEISAEAKPIGSREAMRSTREQSALYAAWPAKCAADLAVVQAAIADRDMVALGTAAESNALAMHATMLGAWPPILYWQPATVAALHRLWAARAAGLEVYATLDAGPNLKLLFAADSTDEVLAIWPGLRVIAPFTEEP